MTTTSDSSKEKSALHKNQELEHDGYKHRFVSEEGGFRCTKTGEFFAPEDLSIVAISRFEGASDPDDMSVMYVVETANGAKGIIQDAYGLYASQHLSNLLPRMQDKRRLNSSAEVR